MVSFLLAVVMLFSAFGIYMSNMKEAKAAGKNPKYVAKMAYKEGDGNGNAIRHNISANDIEVGKTYTFTCNYYVDVDKDNTKTQVASIHFTSDKGWSVGSTNTGTQNIRKVCELTLEHIAEDGDNNLALRIENNTGGDVYLWNIKLCKNGQEIASFRNADFTEQNGTWIGWQMTNYSNNKYISTIDENAAAVKATGHSVLAYNPDSLIFLPDYTLLPDYTWDADKKTLSFSGTMEFDLSTITDYHFYQEGKVFVGWKDADGNYLDSNKMRGATFQEGEVLTADYVDCTKTKGGDFAIRLEEIRTEDMGLRYIVELSNSISEKLKIQEYGTLVLPSIVLDNDVNGWSIPVFKMNDQDIDLLSGTGWSDLTYDGIYSYNGKEYKTAVVKANNIYEQLSDRIYYTLCVTNITEEKYDRQYTVKGYAKYTDKNGIERVLYTDYASTNSYLVSENMMENSSVTDDVKTKLNTVINTVKTKYQAERNALDNGNKTVFAGSEEDLNTYVYELSNGIRVREAVFDSGKSGETVEIMQISDLHYNYANKYDAVNPSTTLLYTMKDRTWGKNGAHTITGRKLLEYARTSDETIITGDIMDYLSNGTIELMQREVWDKYPKTIIGIGNHEFSQKTSDANPEVLSPAERWNWIASAWEGKHDYNYSSKIVKEKVMMIQLNNGENTFYDSQIEPLKNDLKLAKEKGYVVLLFMHEPLVTGNSADSNVVRIGTTGDKESYNFYEGKRYSNVYPEINDATKQVYEIITNNADIIRGVFNGHIHTNFYTEIQAKTSTGETKTIPQYTLISSAFQSGYVMKITVK